MTFSLHPGGVVMSSQIKLTHSPNTHTLAHIAGRCALIFSRCTLFSLHQQHHVTASHSSPGDNPPEGGRAVRKNAGPSKKTQSSRYAPELSTRSYLSRIIAQPQPSSHCRPRPPSRHPFNLMTVYPIPTLLSHPPSTPREPPFYTSSPMHIRDTPMKRFKHFISRFTILL